MRVVREGSSSAPSYKNAREFMSLRDFHVRGAIYFFNNIIIKISFPVLEPSPITLI
jgi:hypothetical protein